jgi:hypothetical protein
MISSALLWLGRFSFILSLLYNLLLPLMVGALAYAMANMVGAGGSRKTSTDQSIVSLEVRATELSASEVDLLRINELLCLLLSACCSESKLEHYGPCRVHIGCSAPFVP